MTKRQAEQRLRQYQKRLQKHQRKKQELERNGQTATARTLAAIENNAMWVNQCKIILAKLSGEAYSER